MMSPPHTVPGGEDRVLDGPASGDKGSKGSQDPVLTGGALTGVGDIAVMKGERRAPECHDPRPPAVCHRERE